MKILVIDDLRTFKFAPEDEVTYARSVDEGWLALTEDGKPVHWDQVWFDNDMGLVNAAKGGDVYPFVVFLEKEYFENGFKLDVDKFYVHSANPIAALTISMVLNRMEFKVERVDANDYM